MDFKTYSGQEKCTTVVKRQRRDESREAQPFVDDEQRSSTTVTKPSDIDYTWLIESRAIGKKLFLEDHEKPFWERCTD